MNRKTVLAIGVTGVIAIGAPAIGSLASPVSGSVATAPAASTTWYWNELPAWRKHTRYTPGTVVRYGTRAYQAVKSGKKHKPSSTSSYWTIVYAVGQPGSGAVGPAGPTGAPGPTGATGATGATGPSNAYQVIAPTAVLLAAGYATIAQLPALPAGVYVLSATTNIVASTGVVNCTFTTLNGEVPGSPLFTQMVATPGSPESVSLTYAIQLPTVPGAVTEPVSLVCRETPFGMAQTYGSSVLTAVKVASLN